MVEARPGVPVGKAGSRPYRGTQGTARGGYARGACPDVMAPRFRPSDRRARMPVERAQFDRAELPASGAREAQPGDTCRNRSADGRVEPKRPPASLPCIPDGDNFLRVCDRLALGLSSLRFGRCTRGCARTFLRSAVGAHSANLNSISGAIGTFGVVGRFSDCHAAVSFQSHGRSHKGA